MAELKSLDESIKSRANETQKGSQDNEERLKKMKSLLLGANKKITEYRNQTSQYESEIDSLKSRIKELEDEGEKTAKEIENKEGEVKHELSVLKGLKFLLDNLKRILEEMHDLKQTSSGQTEELVRRTIQFSHHTVSDLS